jgi:hypothetical protein
MSDEQTRWICHVCDTKATGESNACHLCYKTTCALHLRHQTVFNPQSGLYELLPICVECVLRKALP